MENEIITVSETTIDLPTGKASRVLVFTYSGDIFDTNPVSALDQAVREYVGQEKNYTQFIDLNMDDPCVRVVIYGMRNIH